MKFIKNLTVLSVAMALTLSLGIISEQAGIDVPGVDISFISDAEAKRSGGFSRSSFRSRPSSSRPKFNSNKPKAKPKPKVAPKPKAKPKTFASTPRAARQQTATQRAKFKQPTTRTSKATTSTNYRSNSTYTKARNYDTRTYYSRRSNYYGTWGAPSYAYRGYSSYGMFDALFLWYILDSTSNRGAMAYHYQNDPGYQSWRAEADQLSVENAELRTKLAALDAEVAKQSGPIQEGYVPSGVDADIMLAENVRASMIPAFRACVAGSSGTYANVTTNVIAPNTASANITIVPTSGSREILAKIASGECDGGFVQSDSYWNYIEINETTDLPFTRVLSPYKESVHLVCNDETATTDGLVDLTKKNNVYVPSNSGALETWTNLVGEDEQYEVVKITEVNSYEAALQQAANDDNGCALYVGAKGSSELMRKTEKGAETTKLQLVEVIDKSLLKSTDPAGDRVYSTGTIDDNTYPNLLREGGCYGWCAGDVPTLEVNADFLISNAWKAKNSKAYDSLVLDLTGMSSDIQKAATK